MQFRLHSAGIVLALLGGCTRLLALNPSLEVSQYGHDSWTVRKGFFKGNVYAITQTPDGYFWLPAGQQLPDQNINALLAAREGTLLEAALPD